MIGSRRKAVLNVDAWPAQSRAPWSVAQRGEGARQESPHAARQDVPAGAPSRDHQESRDRQEVLAAVLVVRRRERGLSLCRALFQFAAESDADAAFAVVVGDCVTSESPAAQSKDQRGSKYQGEDVSAAHRARSIAGTNALRLPNIRETAASGGSLRP